MRRKVQEHKCVWCVCGWWMGLGRVYLGRERREEKRMAYAIGDGV